jgi:hypothetical protein
VADRDAHPGLPERGAGALGPLDKSDPAGTEIVAQELGCLVLDARQAVEIKVRHDESTIGSVAMADRECRACDRGFDAQRAASAAHERRLAGAELAGDKDDVALL